MLPTPKIILFPAGGIHLGWKEDQCVGGGMINIGNTCYLNPTLQALFHIPAFANWLRSESIHVGNCTVVNGTINDECIICAMNKILIASKNKRGSTIKPLLIYKRLRNYLQGPCIWSARRCP
jgi:ubiquitin carboxyl-terminal hydrolase 36/42